MGAEGDVGRLDFIDALFFEKGCRVYSSLPILNYFVFDSYHRKRSDLGGLGVIF